MFLAELIDMKSDSRVGYVPSKFACQMVDDDWAAQRQVMPIVTELAMLTREANADAEEAVNCAKKRLYLLIEIQLRWLTEHIWSFHQCLTFKWQIFFCIHVDDKTRRRRGMKLQMMVTYVQGMMQMMMQI
jgi:hypothetical protein